MRKDDFHLFSFINKIELKLPNNTEENNLYKKLSQRTNAKREKFNRNNKRQLENKNDTLKEAVNSTNTSSNNSTEDNEIIEVYSTSDIISNKQLRGNCFLYFNGFFYDLSLIKWPGSSR